MTDRGAWLRLDRRMLLVHPLREVVRFLPVLVGILVAGGASGAGAWGVLSVAAPVVLGVVRYLTTSYRVGPDRVELRRGLVRRHTLSTATDRVRTVDLTATLAHRVLGLATIAIGTGSAATDAAEQIELDGLPRAEAAALRARLLRAGTAVPAEAAAAASPATPVVRFEPRWLWYAPFTSAGVVAAGALAGALSQASEMLDLDLAVREENLRAVTGLIAVAALVALAVAALVIAVVGYLVVNGGFTLTRAAGSWHVRRGLLTTRETSIDEARLAGVSRGEPAALRLVRGARLTAIVTGLGGARESAAVLVPPAPRATVAAAEHAVLGAAAPMEGALRSHGAAAVRRRYGRALLGSAPGVLVVGLLAVGEAAPCLLLAALPVLGIACGLAHDRARSLGHGLVEGHVVARSGSLRRTRDALAVDHVIGWTFRDTWFQRRAGLTTLDATTAGGRGRITVLDVPPDDAVALAAGVTPELVAQFTR